MTRSFTPAPFMTSTARSFLVVFSTCVLLSAACGKSEKAAPAAASAAATPAVTEAQPAPAIASPPAAVNSRKAPKPPQTVSPELIGTVHQFMTEQLHVFILQKGRMPTSFGEFANARMDSVPRPPPGLMWAIDNNTKEVKLIRQQ